LGWRPEISSAVRNKASSSVFSIARALLLE
jgi:hypothetical protein